MLRGRKKGAKIRKILVAPKILEGDLFLCLRLVVFPKQDIVLKIKTEDESSLGVRVLSC